MTNDHDYMTKEHIARFLRTHHTGTDNLGRLYLAQIVKSYEPCSVLDVAAASCINYEVFRNHKIQCSYTGFDRTVGLLQHAKELYGDEIKLDLGMAQELPYEDNSHDVVIIRHLLEHLPQGQYEQVIYEGLRVAKKELIVVFFLRPHDASEDIIEERSSGIEGHPEVTHYWNTYSKSKFLQFILGFDVEVSFKEVHTPGAAADDFIVRIVKR